MFIKIYRHLFQVTLRTTQSSTSIKYQDAERLRTKSNQNLYLFEFRSHAFKTPSLEKSINVDGLDSGY